MEYGNSAETLAWFKEYAILSLCGDYTTRKRTPGMEKQATLAQLGQSLESISRHQIQAMTRIPKINQNSSYALSVINLNIYSMPQGVLL